MRLGLSRETAERLVKQLIYGCGKMYKEEPDKSFTIFRAEVSTPQGTTVEAIHEFERMGLRAATSQAL